LLPPQTEAVWKFLKEQPALSGFVLVGGSALALQIQHRLSEDLDFAYPAERLPRDRIDGLLKIVDAHGFHFSRNDDESADAEFQQGGLNLHDFQQDFLVNDSVKVSFFAPDRSVQQVLGSARSAGPRVATLGEIFKTKCLVSALRSKSRDWYDLYLLLRDHGFTIQDFAAVFSETDSKTQRDIALQRLCSGVPQKDDEGYAYLLEDPPPLEEMTAFFIAQRNALEIGEAAGAKQPIRSNQ
jgi:predicted nucleotidyltransferase component of viral defense system